MCTFVAFKDATSSPVKTGRYTKLSNYVQIKSLPYWEDGEKLLEKLQTEKLAYEKMRILIICIGSEAESSEHSPMTRNLQINDSHNQLGHPVFAGFLQVGHVLDC
uniref:Uncharacterized protein n=1 Tax=Acrobeloides nanus TaxID=290746 RepID=A0A914CQN7_9BILA